MTGLSDYSAQALLAYIVGKTAMPSLPTAYVALFTAVGTDANTGFTEVSGGSYARVSTAGGSWNAASGSAPSSISNSATLTFPTATAGWGTVIAFGLFDASTVGNLLAWDFLGNYAWLPFTNTSVGSAAGAVFTVKAHGYSSVDPVVGTVEYGGTFPTFTQQTMTAYQINYVANGATDTFTLCAQTSYATTASIWTSSTGSGTVRKIVQQSIPTGVQASFAGGSPGALVITSA